MGIKIKTTYVMYVIIPHKQLPFKDNFSTAPEESFTVTPLKLLTGLLSSSQLSFLSQRSPPVARYSDSRIFLCSCNWSAENIINNEA